MWKANGRTHGRRTLTHDKTSHGLLPGELKTGWLRIKIMCSNGATYLPAKCCFSELALLKPEAPMSL